MHKTILLCFALSLIALSQSRCVKGYTPDDSTSPINSNPIRFDNIQVGQTSQYIGVIGNDRSTGNLTYTDDTLYVSVIGQSSNGFLVAETFHWIAFVNEWVQPEKDSVFLYYIRVQNDTLQVESTNAAPVLSRIFTPNVEKNGLPLAQLTGAVANLSGWTSDLPFCTCRQGGFAANQTLLGQSYLSLNILADNTAMANAGGLGETYAYSRENGIVRAAQYKDGSSQDGFAWDLLPKKE